MAYTYYNNGNIHTISKVGTYSYDSGRPHAVTAIDNAVGRAIPPTQCDVTYNLHKHPSSISGNSYSITLDHIYAEGREVTPHVKNGNADSLYYPLTDHLGSWENARLYDPTIGRFFSPDPFVQAPDFTQNYNRYSYCLNNPVMYSDPTGEVFGIDDIIAAAALGAIFNAFTQIVAGNVNDVGDFFVAAGIGALSGAAGFAIGNGVNAAIAGGSFASGFVGSSTVSSTGFWAGAGTGAASGFASGFISGTGNSLLAENSFGQSLQNGWKEGLMGLGSGAVIGGICGGIDAAINHREFFTGNAKQYDFFPANYASIDGGTEMFLNTDDYTVINNSDYVAYYKPEEVLINKGHKANGKIWFRYVDVDHLQVLRTCSYRSRSQCYEAVIGGMYRVRYITGKPGKTATIYIDEPVYDTIYDNLLFQHRPQ